MQKEELIVHLQLFIRPTIVATLIASLWYFVFFRFGFCILESDESAFTDAGVPVVAMFHAIIAGHILAKVWDEHKEVRRCIRDNDRDSFRRCLHDRVPMAIQLLLGSLSVISMALALVFHFNGPRAGIILNFAVAFVLALYWEVATNLDDPRKGVWYVGQIPPHWLD